MVTISSATGIRLVTGDSVLEMGSNGQVNLYCTKFAINASGTGQINTGGTLDLNLKDPDKATNVAPTPADIQNEVAKTFTPDGEGQA